MRRFNFATLEMVAIGMLALAALAAGLFAMVSRYLFPEAAVGWADELVVYLMMWSLWLSMGRLVADNAHVRADILIRKFSARWQARLLFLNNLLGLIFSCAMAFAGAQVVILALRLGEKSESVLQFPIAFYDLSLPVGMFLMGARYLRNCLVLLKGTPLSTPGGTAQ